MERPKNEPKHYQTFEDLEVYRVPREFRRAMYQVAKRLPQEENLALTSQIRGAAISLTNNIAEGHGRFHFLEQIKFILQSRGSLEELIDDLNVCEDEKYLSTAEVDTLKQEAWRVHQLINGYIRFLRRRIGENPSRVRESPSNAKLSEAEIDDLCFGRFNGSTL